MKHHNSGYTLIELSIVLVITVLLLNFSVVSLGSLLDTNNYSNTKTQLSNIQQALNSYFQKFQALPCPARFNALPGDSDYNSSGICDPQSTCTSGINCNSTVAIGALPTANLLAAGVTLRTGLDAWDDKIVYAVDRRFVQSNSYNECTNNGKLIIQDGNSNTITNKAIYVLLSLGKNKAGAYNIDAANSVPCNLSLTEAENCNHNNETFITSTYNDKITSSSYYDDVLVWQTNPNYLSAPANISGCVLWLDGADFCTINRTGTTVNSWNDKSTSNLTAISIAAPTFIPNASSTNKGHSYLNFTGSSLMSISGFTGMPTSNFTIIAVISPTTMTGNSAIINAANSATLAPATANKIFGLRPTNLSFSLDGTNIASSGTAFSSATAYIVAVISSSTDGYKLYINGQSNSSGIQTTSTALTFLNIGGYASWGSYNGHLLEVLFYNKQLSTYEQNAVESYLADKWAINY